MLSINHDISKVSKDINKENRKSKSEEFESKDISIDSVNIKNDYSQSSLNVGNDGFIYFIDVYNAKGLLKCNDCTGPTTYVQLINI